MAEAVRREEPGARQSTLAAAVREWLADLRGRRTYRRFRDQEDRSRRIRAQVTAIAAAAATVVYLAWVTTVLNLTLWWLAIPFLVAELASFAIFVSFFTISWHPRYHDPQGRTMETPLFTVDVFITACGEPFELVARTVRAAAAMTYEKKRVWILDDRADRRLQELARALDCGYLARLTRDHAKAGNLNYGLARTRGDLVLALDADQVPHPELISDIVGYFELPYIGFVQTKQCFDVPAGDPLGNTDPIFYELMQLGKDGTNAAFSCGSGVMYRRDALFAVGGFSTWNVVEDLHTSMRLHAAGWRSVYHNHALTRGTAPTHIRDASKQRYQWATDTLRMLFWDNPFRRAGLSWLQKVQYAHLGVVYLFAGFVMPFFYALPIISLFTGKYVISTALTTYILFRMPSLFLTNRAYRYQFAVASTSTSADFGRASNVWLGYFPAFIAATATALRTRTRRLRYTVTPKTKRPRGGVSELLPIVPQTVLIVASLAAIVYGVPRAMRDVDLFVLNSVWCLWTVRTMWPLCWAVWRSPRGY